MIHKLKTTTILPVSLNEAWNFFSRPENLNEITPPDVKFKITAAKEDIQRMYEGMFITYKISPFLGIYFDWVTEITHVEDKSFFVDEQRMGPYKIWHHEHHFKPISDSTTEMTDILHYAMPYGIFGKIAHAFAIKKQVQGIFTYRESKIKELFQSK
jgi:ligand-binding SRPBCC domain-containing protein